MIQDSLFEPAERDLSAFRACAAPECQNEAKGRHGRFCSDACRARQWKAQKPLTRAEKILARLRLGQATGLELLQAGGGTRYSARILELRERGYEIETDMGGEWPVYRLRSEP